MHGTPFALRSARLSPPFCSLCYLKSPVRLSIHYRRSISTEHRALQTLPNTVRGGHSAHPSSGPPISWWTSAPSSHLNHTSACIHRSIPPSRLLALKHVYIMTLTPLRNPCNLEPNFTLVDLMGNGSIGDGSARSMRCDEPMTLHMYCKISALHAHAARLAFPRTEATYLHCYRSYVSTSLNNTTASSDRRVTSL